MNGEFILLLALVTAFVGAVNALLFPELLARSPTVKFLQVHKKAKLPKYKTEGAACFDFFSPVSACIAPGKKVAIPIGLKVEVPNKWALDIFGRSGAAYHFDLSLANCVGIIDSDFRDQIVVMIRNNGVEPYTVCVGDSIAQGRLTPIKKTRFSLVNSLTETERGEGGLGSTGR